MQFPYRKLLAANETGAAQRVARSAWRAFGHLCVTADKYPEYTWPRLFHGAGLVERSAEIARDYLRVLRSADEMSLAVQNTTFRVRTWCDDEEAILADWLHWIRKGTPFEGWEDGGPAAEYYRAEKPDAARYLVEETLAELQNLDSVRFDKQKNEWCHWMRYPVGAYLTVGDPDKLERAAKEAIANGHESYWVWMADVAILKGSPISPGLIEKLKEDSETDYFLEYYIARDAGAAGDVGRAFGALEQALAIWTNPPLRTTDMWEKDALWGDLRGHPDFRRLFAEKRRRIGPVKGTLWYFPGWLGHAV